MVRKLLQSKPEVIKKKKEKEYMYILRKNE